VILDLDHFKKINDNHGHPAGDQVLREMGKAILANSRSNDFAARYGGEEFVIILPETPLNKAMVQAERLRNAVFESTFGAPELNLKATISVGLAALNDSQDKPEDLIRQADLALYAAKRGGRNRICCHTTEEEGFGNIDETASAFKW